MRNIVITGLLFLIAAYVCTCARAKGRFRTITKSLAVCNETELPFVRKDPPAIIQMELFNKSNKVLIRGSMRCVRDIKNAQVKAEAYLWSRGKWMPHITFPGLSCDNALIRTIITAATNVRVSADDCTLMKGYYNTSGMEVNWIEHMWAQERVYGNVLWKVVLYTPKNTLACYMVEAEVKPLKH